MYQANNSIVVSYAFDSPAGFVPMMIIFPAFTLFPCAIWLLSIIIMIGYPPQKCERSFLFSIYLYYKPDFIFGKVCKDI